MKRTVFAAITLLLAITLQAQRLLVGEQSSGIKRVNNRMYNPDPALYIHRTRSGHGHVFPYARLAGVFYHRYGALDGSWYRIEYG